MHPAAREWVVRARANLSICEFGSRDVNGGIRDLFPGWTYVGVDNRPGKGVHVVADATEWDGDGRVFDVVVCCEVLEHTPGLVRKFMANAFRILKPGGWFIVTAAGPGRGAHTCDAQPMTRHPQHGYPEPYENVLPEDLRTGLYRAGFESITVNVLKDDVRATARKPFRVPPPGLTVA